MMQATRKRQHRSGRELAGVREGRSPRRSRDRHETGRRYAKAISTNLCQKGTTEEDIMDTISVCENSKNTKECSETRQLEDTTVNDNNATEKAFPWLLEFNKIVCSSRGNRNYQHLKQLLLYTQKVLSVETSNVKLDPINLKNNINNILIFFHLYWLDIKQETADHSLYLNKMSALLSVYIDMDRDIDRDIHMELKTSRQEEEEIDLKILAALCIYLNNSEEHIFKVLIRIKHMTEKYTQICNHIFTKSLTNLKIKHQDKTSLNDVAYIRYLLAFKMWKKMEKISDKNEIDKLALELLGPRMPKLRDELIKFVPSPTNPTDQENETQWLLNIDLKQTHEHFLLFEDQMDSLLLEDKIDNSAYLQCIQAINIGQNSQKHQMSLLFHRNNPTSNREVNKNYLNSLQNNNMALSINGNKSLEKTYLQKKKRRDLKSLKKKDKTKRNKTKKIKKKPGKIIDIIDLTTDDEISVYSTIKRKKTKHNLECSQIKKDTVKNKNHINPLKHSSGLVASVNIEKSSNRASKSTVEKVCPEHKPIPNDKISIESSISNRSSLNNIYLQKSEHSNQVNNICPEFVKEEDENFDYNSHYLKSMFHSILNQYIKAFNDMTNVLKESKTENHDVSHMTYMTGNAIGSYNNTIMPSKETLISQEKSVMDTIPLSKMCQNNIVDQHFLKQEIPISTSCNAMQKSYNYWKTMPVVKQASFCNLHRCIICNIIYNFLNIEEAIDDITKLDCIKDMEKISFFISMKIQDILHMLNATNHGECVMVKSAEQRVQYLDNKRKYDQGHGSKHPETTIKAQQGRNDCNTSNETSNDRLHLFKRDKFNTDSVDMDFLDMNSVDMDPVDMDSVDMDSISFSNKIEILEILENVMSTETREFLLRSSLHLN